MALDALRRFLLVNTKLIKTACITKTVLLSLITISLSLSSSNTYIIYQQPATLAEEKPQNYSNKSTIVGGYDLSQIESHSAVCLSVRRKEKNVFPVACRRPLRREGRKPKAQYIQGNAKALSSSPFYPTTLLDKYI